MKRFNCVYFGCLMKLGVLQIFRIFKDFEANRRAESNIFKRAQNK